MADDSQIFVFTAGNREARSLLDTSIVHPIDSAVVDEHLSSKDARHALADAEEQAGGFYARGAEPGSRTRSTHFGGFTVADAMHAPASLRFVTYEIEVAPKSQGFVDTIRALPAIREWIRVSEAEPDVLDPFGH